MKTSKHSPLVQSHLLNYIDIGLLFLYSKVDVLNISVVGRGLCKCAPLGSIIPRMHSRQATSHRRLFDFWFCQIFLIFSVLCSVDLKLCQPESTESHPGEGPQGMIFNGEVCVCVWGGGGGGGSSEERP